MANIMEMDAATGTALDVDESSCDVVDFAAVANYHHNNNNSIKNNNNNNNNKCCDDGDKSPKTTTTTVDNNKNSKTKATSNKKKTLVNNSAADRAATDQKRTTTKERLTLFSFGRKSQSNNSHNNNNNKIKPSGTTPPVLQRTPNNSTSQQTAQKASEASSANQIKTTSILFTTTQTRPIGTPPRQHKFVKSSSLSRLLGNTYNAKKFEKQEQKRLANDAKFHTFHGRRSGPYFERFKRCPQEDGADAETCERDATAADMDVAAAARSLELVSLAHFQQHPQHRHEVLGVRAYRTLTRGLGKLWWKRSHSVEISTPDPEFKVSYLGNVLTGWAKGEGCVEKQLNTLWRNYTQNNKPDVVMRIKVCASGLKATTRQHGLTEYWANRITHCCAPANYPRVFCWIYRHEGRKLKHELRCHAVLCSKEKFVQDICHTLKENLEGALREFKRDKILKQNARLSLANAAYDNPSLPRRKIMLSVGGNNYRPPLERSKSAPKLMSIEEAIGEEEGDEIEETNEPEMKSCCQRDSLYPAMTLGRRRCRRGHSIRRTGKARPDFCTTTTLGASHVLGGGCCHAIAADPLLQEEAISASAETLTCDKSAEEQQNSHSYGSDDSDDFDKLLKYNDYDAGATLTKELLPYFDMQLHKNTSSSLGSLSELKDRVEDDGDDVEPLSLIPTINSDPNADPASEYSHDLHNHHHDDDEVVGLRRNGVCSDGEEDYIDNDDLYFRQAAILNIIHRNSMRKMANLSLSSDEGSSIETNGSASLPYHHHHHHHQLQSSISSNASSTASTTTSGVELVADATNVQCKQLNADSDEGSISSGCETASIATANQDDLSLTYRQGIQHHHHHNEHQQQQQQQQQLSTTHQLSEHGLLDEEPITVEEIYQRLESRLQGRHNSDATTFSSSSSITLKLGVSPTPSVNGLDGAGGLISTTAPSAGTTTSTKRCRARRQAAQRPNVNDDDTDESNCSDESGYVEFQERDKSANETSGKPQPPPKPLPRRFVSTTAV